MNKIISAAIIVGIILICGFLFKDKITGHTITGGTIDMTKNVKILMETSMGKIELELYPEKAPITVENFLNYVQSGAYENTIFHRVIAGFMIQGGGFTTSGEEKETDSPIKLESNNGLKNLRGTIAMARTNIPDSATNQFFINVADNDFLNYGFRDEGYAVFGKVTKGMDVVDKIAKVQTGAEDKPLQNIIIKSVKLI